MTRKRYIKLVYALFQKMHQSGAKVKWGQVLKAPQRISFENVKYNSYAEAWESLTAIRKQYGM